MFEGVSNFMLRAARNIFDSNSTPSFVLDLPRAKDSSHHQDYYISKLGKTYALCRKTLLFATVSGWGVDPILVLWCTGTGPFSKLFFEQKTCNKTLKLQHFPHRNKQTNKQQTHKQTNKQCSNQCSNSAQTVLKQCSTRPSRSGFKTWIFRSHPIVSAPNWKIRSWNQT